MLKKDLSNGGTINGSLTTVGNILPGGATQTYSLGSTTAQWLSLFVYYIRDAVNNIRIETGGSDGTKYLGYEVDDANAIAHRFGSVDPLTNATARIAGFFSNSTFTPGTEKLAIDKNGKIVVPTGGAADVAGLATLVGGTVTVSTTAVTASSKILYSRATTGGTLGHLSAPVASISAGASFVINSSSGTDTSTVYWFIVN